MTEEMKLFEIILRTTFSFMTLLLMARLMGRKQLSQLTFFNYITGITLGSIAGEMASKTSTSFWNGLTSVIWWSLLTILISFVGLKSSKARVLLDGQPVVVMKHGKILENELRKLQLNMDDLSMLLREKDIFSTQDVEHAVFEPHGKLSIMLKEEKIPVTKQDQHLFTVRPKYIPMEIVVDGKVVDKNLKEAGVSLDWLRNQLKVSNIDLGDVFYIELQKDGSLYIDLRNDNLKK
jgi:uncharacterized membrane protein YcaP (DUF421 family)